MGAIEDATRFEQPKRWISSVRAYLHAAIFGLIFGLAAGTLGIVSFLFQRHGNLITNYPSNSTKYTLGLILFNSIFTFLIVIGSAWAPMFFFIFILFADMVIWIVAAGVLNDRVPFRAWRCGDTFSPRMAPWANECSLYAGLEALSWTLFAVTLLALVKISYDTFKLHKKTVYGQ